MMKKQIKTSKVKAEVLKEAETEVKEVTEVAPVAAPAIDPNAFEFLGGTQFILDGRPHIVVKAYRTDNTDLREVVAGEGTTVFMLKTLRKMAQSDSNFSVTVVGVHIGR